MLDFSVPLFFVTYSSVCGALGVYLLVSRAFQRVGFGICYFYVSFFAYFGVLQFPWQISRFAAV